MKNQRAAIDRRLSDPDFQGVVVRNSLICVMALAVLLAIFAIHDAWEWTHPPKPVYFFVDGHNMPIQAKPLDSPIVDDTELLNWTVKWVLAAYNIDYYRYAEQLSAAGQHYTSTGWTTFANSLHDSGNFEKMKQSSLLCFAQAKRAAVIQKTMIVNGRLAYAIQFPMVQTCENTNDHNDLNLMMTAVVVRTDEPDHPDGLAIDQLVAIRQ
jgi:intracellular multiplication protein IcmL